MATPEKAPQPKRKESWLGVAVTALSCAAFLWWWFSLPATPEPVGMKGLADRAVAEAKKANAERDVAFQLDLFELAMLRVRHAGLEEATPIAEHISREDVRDRFWLEAALSTFNEQRGDYSPALKICDKIQTPTSRQQAKEAVIYEMAHLDLQDAALLLAEKNTPLQARLARLFAESGSPEKAAEILTKLEALPAAEIPTASHVDLAWTNLWLRRWEKVEASISSLPAAEQTGLWQDYFRATRLERPEAAGSVLAKIPEPLRLPLRLEAATQAQGGVEVPVALLQEMKAAAESSQTPAAWISLAEAAWKLQNDSVLPWKKATETASALAEKEPPVVKANIASDVASLYLDAADLATGKTLLTQALSTALTIPDASQRFPVLAKLYDQAFRSGEADHAQKVLTALQNTLSQIPPPGPDVSTLVTAEFRDGQWSEALKTMAQQPDKFDANLQIALTKIVESTAVESLGLSQDLEMTTYRQLAQAQGEAPATLPALRLGPGLARARSWLAIAKGLSKMPKETKPEEGR